MNEEKSSRLKRAFCSCEVKGRNSGDEDFGGVFQRGDRGRAADEWGRRAGDEGLGVVVDTEEKRGCRISAKVQKLRFCDTPSKLR